MDSLHPLKALALLLATLMPAVWWGIETRRLLIRHGDPLLPERLLAARRRASFVLICSLAVVAGVMAKALWWAVPIALLCRAAAGFSLRRRLYEETWSFGTMVSSWIRSIVGVYGFHFALLALPFVVGMSRARVWIAASLAAIVLLAWSYWYSSVLRLLLRATPVTDPVLVDAFSDLVTRAGIAPPRFEYVNMRGGSMTNAVALPALTGSSVLFSSPLLERLQTDEIVAIAAHEIAHLEYYSPRRLRQYRLAQWSLIAIGAFAFRLWPAGVPAWVQAVVWFALILVVLGSRARKRQRNETESDRRAVALTGAPEALARGLAKLNAFARLPRRWDAALERRATHPSLGRRIRDIYAAAGVAPPASTASEVFTDAGTSTSVTFGPGHLQWSRDGAEHNLPYGALSELRVVARRTDTAALVAADRFGHRWEVPLAADDIGRAQRILDSVDVHVLPGMTGAGPGPAARITSLLVAAVALAAGQFGGALVAVLTAAVASTRLFVASAAACTAASALAFRDGSLDRGVALLVCAATCAAFAVLHRRTTGASSLDRRALAVMGVASAIAVLLLFDNGFGTFRLHQAARAVPAAPVLLLATAAAIRVRAANRWIRYAVLLIAIAGVALAYAGSAAFVNGFVADPLLVRAPVIRPTTVAAAPIATMPVPFEPTQITLSPDGSRVMLWRDEEDIGDRPGDDWTVSVGAVGGTLSPMKADDAVFATGGRILAVNFDDHDATVQMLAPGAAPTWHTRVDGLAGGSLTLAPDQQRWTIVGWDGDRQPVEASGTIGAAAADILRWPGTSSVVYTSVASDGKTAVALEQHYRRSRLSWTLARWAMALPYASDTRIWRLEGHDRRLVADSQLQTACVTGVVADRFACAAFDDTRTRIATVDVASGRILPVGIVTGRFTPFAAHSTVGWLSGWRNGSAMAIRLDGAAAFDLPLPRGSYARAITGAGNRLAAVIATGERTIVAVYPLR